VGHTRQRGQTHVMTDEHIRTAYKSFQNRGEDVITNREYRVGRRLAVRLNWNEVSYIKTSAVGLGVYI